MEEGIASLQAKYEECIAKKQELEFKTEQCSARLGRAEKVSVPLAILLLQDRASALQYLKYGNATDFFLFILRT